MTIQEYTRRAEDLERQTAELIRDIMDETTRLEAKQLEEYRPTKRKRIRRYMDREYYTGENRTLNRIIAAKDSLRMSIIIAEEYGARFPEQRQPEAGTDI